MGGGASGTAEHDRCLQDTGEKNVGQAYCSHMTATTTQNALSCSRLRSRMWSRRWRPPSGFAEEDIDTDRIYDDHGNRMSPSHARKLDIRYHYYVSSPFSTARPGGPDRCVGCRRPRSKRLLYVPSASISRIPHSSLRAPA